MFYIFFLEDPISYECESLVYYLYVNFDVHIVMRFVDMRSYEEDVGRRRVLYMDLIMLSLNSMEKVSALTLVLLICCQEQSAKNIGTLLDFVYAFMSRM